MIGTWILPRLPLDPARRQRRRGDPGVQSGHDAPTSCREPGEARLYAGKCRTVEAAETLLGRGRHVEADCRRPLVRMRAFVLVFEALAALSAEHRRRIHLSFVGDGPDEARLKRIVAKRALSDIVTFCGQMSRAATLDAMSRAHLLVFPSLRDNGSSSIAEAMALGLPVLAFDLAGPGDMARGVGFLVTATTPSQTATRIREILDTLIDDRRPLYEASARGLQRAPDLFDWSRRLAVYETLCYAAVANADGGVTRPDMGKSKASG